MVSNLREVRLAIEGQWGSIMDFNDWMHKKYPEAKIKAQFQSYYIWINFPPQTTDSSYRVTQYNSTHGLAFCKALRNQMPKFYNTHSK